MSWADRNRASPRCHPGVLLSLILMEADGQAHPVTEAPKLTLQTTQPRAHSLARKDQEREEVTGWGSGSSQGRTPSTD